MVHVGTYETEDRLKKKNTWVSFTGSTTQTTHTFLHVLLRNAQKQSAVNLAYLQQLQTKGGYLLKIII
jgi:hypothetical protein